MKSRTLAVALAALGLTCSVAIAQTKWDLPAAYPPGNFHTVNLVQFAGDVDKAMKLYKASRPALEKLLAAQGIKLLYVVPWPPQGIFSKKPINGIADMKGLKWRAYSPATARIAELVGAQPVTVQVAELSQAMATGVIDSMMTSGSTGFDTKTFEYIKNFYDTQAWLPKNAVIVNQKAFEVLDKSAQDALLKASAQAETRGWKESDERTQWYYDQLRISGMAVRKPSAQLAADLKKVGDTMLQDWLKKAGPDGQAVVDAYRKM
jgi:TRAP-type C4-dicarboxylate transport system substrate-binding protein